MKKFFVIIFSILLIDQVLKIYIKTHFKLGDGVFIFSFFRILFVENPGMAYGISFNEGYHGKIILSILRFFLVFFISIFLYRNIKKDSSKYFTIPISLILSGAIGNFLDSALYGLLFNTGTIYNQEYKKWIPYIGISKINYDFFEKNRGYASIMEGCVVDMFYFPIIDTYIPYWIPFFGGYNFQFFKPIFNLSDVMISIGMFLLIIFKSKIRNVKIL
ncbi:lipoprotein signal peptidase [Blattabacterium sp. DPU]|uniref:lipoprotein signal peptidase n=1 Tax=Blattabacterium sp. DPU TaxID=2715232 RepID=UPI00140E93D2|nr:lipoprotein signal peptidase [Blattabacterium sp. DPU]QIK16562.1 lipoprotein signal peptidase [Blattabacterium sp. DPU]